MGVFAPCTMDVIMAELKTQKTKNSVSAFIKTIGSTRQADCKTIVKKMKEVTGSPPAMWGSSIIGFGESHLKYASGRELEWFKIGFSPRKTDFSLYVLNKSKKMTQLLKKLGPHKAGKGCLYVKSLDEIDQEVLSQIFRLACNSIGGCCS